MKKLTSLFQELPGQLLSAEAEERIFTAFRLAQARILRRNFYLSVGGAVLSLGILGAASYLLLQSFLQSEFWTFVRLVFSDLSVVSSNITDFFFLLLETLPVEPLLFLFLGLGAFFWSTSFLLSIREQQSLRFSRHFSLTTSK